MSKKLFLKIKKRALNTLIVEANAIQQLNQSINEEFCQCVLALFHLKGRVIVSGLGKSGLIAQKITATLNSTGTPACFMHSGDALHGDLGMVQEGDLVLLISKSGETVELKLLAQLLKQKACQTAAIVGNAQSSVGKLVDFVLLSPIKNEACPNNLAPTSSTMVQLAIGDALALCLQELRTFSAEDFAKLHPAGMLGKQLSLRVIDLIEERHLRPVVTLEADIQAVIMEISSKRLGATAVLDQTERVLGIITDGDLRRAMQKTVEIQHLKAQDMMTPTPITINCKALAFEALQLMNQKKITQLIVLEGVQYMGMIHIHQVLKEGFINPT